MSLWRKRQIKDLERITMDEDEFRIEFPEEGYAINLSEVAHTGHICPTIRLFALDLQKNPYARIGDWFRELSDTSLEELLNIAEETNENNPDALEQMMLLSQMLAMAEGTLNLNDLDTVRKQMGVTIQLIAMVSLDRKGLVRVFYDNLTLGDDMGDAIIVERI
jgi:hypothetical protein